ncbi:MAG: T9SS type A sorting domain-containing protein [Gemmatimonadota bacterium]|nr:MAG: T9SS type A sorting domain-containing protein [Gemmatimonadota bacterium]
MFQKFPPFDVMNRVFVVAVGLLLTFPVLLGAVGSGDRAVVELSSSEVRTDLSVRTVQVPVAVSNTKVMAGVQLSVKFDTEGMVPGEPELTARSASMSIASNSKDGEMVVLLYSTDGKGISPGDGPIVSLSFAIMDGMDATGAIRLEKVILASPEATALPAVVRPTTISVGSRTPTRYDLTQNYPNPFNPTTSIRYAVVGDQSPPHVTLKIYTVLGQEVQTLVDEPQKSGYYTIDWDGRDQYGAQVASGIYFCRLRAGDYAATIRMVLMK